MILNRIGKAIKNQDWFVVLIELLIVVVGIYIGLQVDEWQKEREARAITQSYYTRLLDDLQNARVTNDARIVYNETALEHAFAALKALEGPEQAVGQQFLIDVYQATQVWPYESYRATFDEILASGISNAIPDIKLRTRLSNFYTDFENLRFSQEETPALRNHLRSIMPNSVQKAIRQKCGETAVRDEEFLVRLTLTSTCDLGLPEEEMRAAITILFQNDILRQNLNRQIATLELKIRALEANMMPIGLMIEYIEEAQQ